MVNAKSRRVWNYTKLMLEKNGLYDDNTKLYADCKDDGNVVLTIQGVSDKFTTELRGIIEDVEEVHPCARLRIARSN